MYVIWRLPIFTTSIVQQEANMPCTTSRKVLSHAATLQNCTMSGWINNISSNVSGQKYIKTIPKCKFSAGSSCAYKQRSMQLEAAEHTPLDEYLVTPTGFYRVHLLNSKRFAPFKPWFLMTMKSQYVIQKSPAYETKSFQEDKKKLQHMV